MTLYISKRIFTLLINVFVVTCLVFIVSRSLPHDQVLPLLGSENGPTHTINFDREYSRLSSKMGYDKPIFYFSILPSSYPDNLYQIPKYKQAFVKMLIAENGNWNYVKSFLDEINNLSNQKTYTKRLSKLYQLENLKSMNDMVRSDTLLNLLRDPLSILINDRSPINNYLLKIHFHGINNQFHHWFVGILHGQYGVSSVDGRPVADKIIEGIRWTVLINLVSILLIFGLGLFLGVLSDYTRSIWLKKFIFSLSYIFYAIPVFWLASLLIVFFTSGSSESLLGLFPPVGRLLDCRGLNIIECFLYNFKFLLLPIICLTLPVLAYFTRITKSSIDREKKERYVLFLKAQGYTRFDIYFKNILKNALAPIVTLIGQSIPAIISGSLVIEIIFNIPGTGRLIYEAILSQDWNVVFIIVIIVSILTMIGYLISDILYRLLNPKLSFRN